VSNHLQDFTIVATVLRTSPRRFVSTEAIDRLTQRTLRYLNSGYSVHLRGPAGTGKTTLALHLADLLQRPMMLMFGDDEAKTSDLIGKQSGYTRKKVVDNYIHSVMKIEDQMRQTWVDSRLTLACREGYTLIYDEFNRSRPEVNNVLLSVLEEKILALPPESNRVEYLKVSPQFRIIFTSNPEEYCGVHGTQDALMDRLITIDIPEPDELTQQEILCQKSELDATSVATIVAVVKAFRIHTQSSASSGLRSCLMISKICKDHEISVDVYNPEFRDLCADILLSRSSQSIEESVELLWQVLQDKPPAWARNNDAVQHVLKELIPVVITPGVNVAQEKEALSKPSAQIADLALEDALESIEMAVLASNGEHDLDQLGDSIEWDDALEASAPEETAAKLDNEAWKAVLETSLPMEEVTMEETASEDVSTLSDLFSANVDPSLMKYVDLSPEPIGSGFVRPSAAVVAEPIAEPIAEPSTELFVLADSWADFPVSTTVEALAETPVETAVETTVEAPVETSVETSVEADIERSIEDQLFQYLLSCENGARLAQIELDLQLPRSQAVDAIRELAKSHRLAQRDRHFFALK
jgi:gas vesicle protein GvpN